MESKDLFVALLGAAILAPQARSQNITFNQADRLNPYYPYNMTKADLNKDGYPDLMFSLPSSLNMYTLNSNGTGDYADWTIPTSYCPSVPLGVDDFLRDGNQGILAGYPDPYTRCGGTSSQGATFAEYSNNGAAIFNQYGIYPGETVAAVVADFNGDQKLDIVAFAYDTTGTASGFFRLYYGDGYGGFSQPFLMLASEGGAVKCRRCVRDRTQISASRA